jgi:hypothetical protein
MRINAMPTRGRKKGSKFPGQGRKDGRKKKTLSITLYHSTIDAFSDDANVTANKAIAQAVEAFMLRQKTEAAIKEPA